MSTRILSLIAVILLITISACSQSGSMTGTGGGNDEELTKIGTPVGDEPVPHKQRAVTEEYLQEYPKWEGPSGAELMGIEFDISAWEISVFTSGGDSPVVVSFVIDDDGAIVTAENTYQLDLSIEDGMIVISDAADTFEAELVHVVNFSNSFKVETEKTLSEFDSKKPEDASSEYHDLGPKFPF